MAASRSGWISQQPDCGVTRLLANSLKERHRCGNRDCGPRRARNTKIFCRFFTGFLLAHCGGGQDKPGRLGPSAESPGCFFFPLHSYHSLNNSPAPYPQPPRSGRAASRVLAGALQQTVRSPPAFYQRKTETFESRSAYRFQEEARIPPWITLLKVCPAVANEVALLTEEQTRFYEENHK